jgi:ribosomal protein S18 acetylase RimI-like enzyme
MYPRVWRFREIPQQRDVSAVKGIVTSCNMFYPMEIEIALELIDERLQRGEESGYHFVFVENRENVLGYSCYGPIPMTDDRYDLYWIAVHQSLHGHGIGKALMAYTESIIWNRNGKRIYVETSSRSPYDNTRAFYMRMGYAVDAVLKDYYQDGDDKIIFSKKNPSMQTDHLI